MRAKKFDAERMRKLLRKLRDDCKDQDLGVECAMITAMMAAVAFADTFEECGRQVWLGRFGTLRQELRNLQHALEHEYKLDEPTTFQFKPGDRVCIPDTRTTGTILSVGDTRAQVQYDHGPIREPLLSILRPAEKTSAQPWTCMIENCRIGNDAEATHCNGCGQPRGADTRKAE
jgi:hypothetical protein